MSAPATEPPAAPPDPAARPRDLDAHERIERAYGGILQRAFRWAFQPVTYPAAASENLRALADRGPVVYVSRSAAFVTFVFFQHLFLRIGAPVAQAVVGLGSPVWAFWGRFLAGRRVVRAPLKDDVVRAVSNGENAMVFLRRPGSLVAQAVLSAKDPFPALVRAQRTLDRPIHLVPQILIWERRPPALRKSLFDALFGEPEAPGLFRSLISFLWNRRRAFVKFGEPVDLKAFLDRNPGATDEIIARKVRGVLHQHLARETRVVTGPPLKSSERLIRETLRDRGLRATLAELTRERGKADSALEREAEKDVREIAAQYSPRMIDFLGWLLGLVFERIYDGVDVDEAGVDRLKQVASRGPLVVCPSHKSHIDYLVMSFVFYRRGLVPPHIAAGINLSFWPLGPVFRRSGAFFIRRSFKGDRVYAAALKAYVRKLVKDGFSQEFFVEGQRSRTGKVLLPRYGMLAMEVDAWIDGVRPDITFCPTWIGYAQIIEGSAYARELAGGEKKKEDLGALLRAPTVLTSRYGRVYIRFDEPVSLEAIAKERGFDRDSHTDEDKRRLTRALGFRIVEGINRATALTPSGLLSTALLAHDRRGLTAPDLRDRLEFLARLAQDAGGTTTFQLTPEALDPLGTGPIREARAALEKAKSITVHETGGEHIFQVVPAERVAMDYPKNTALHFFVPDALLATALLTSKGRGRADLQARTLAVSRLFKHEFIYPAGGFAPLFDRRVARFEQLGLVRVEGGEVHPTPGGAPRLRLLADLVVNFVESYIVATDALSLLLTAPREQRELLKLTLERARASYLAGRIRKYESLSRVTFENALVHFEELGVLEKTGEKGRSLRLSEPNRSTEALAARLDEVRAFLVEKAE